MRDEGVIYVAGHDPLLNKRCTRLPVPGVSASEMTHIVSGGALNSTHSLTHSLIECSLLRAVYWVLVSCYAHVFVLL